MENQAQLFKLGEGNAYYGRNKNADHSRDPLQPVIYKYVKKCIDFPQEFDEHGDKKKKKYYCPPHVAEVGCSDGWRLKQIYKEFEQLYSKQSCCLFGIDPSQDGIVQGNKPDEISRHRNKNFGNYLWLYQSTSNLLPYVDKNVDILVFGFCLYLVPPELLTETMKEADRVLTDGGYLIIYDFFNENQKFCDYKHNEKIKVNKMDFTKMFLWHPSYRLIEHITVDHKDGEGDDENDRVGISVLKKN